MGDVLYLVPGTSELHGKLWDWNEDNQGLQEFVSDFHSLELEHWVWRRREALGSRVMDVGEVFARCREIIANQSDDFPLVHHRRRGALPELREVLVDGGLGFHVPLLRAIVASPSR